MFRKLAFAKQPTDTVIGTNTTVLNVTVLDENGNHDTAFGAAISIALEDVPFSLSEIMSRPPNAIPKRLRATVPKCEDAISNVFYILPQ